MTTNPYVSIKGRRDLLIGKPLSPREVYVTQGIALGYSYKEIAQECILSEHTVKTHIARALAKLGAVNGAHAVALAYRQGLIL